MPAVGFSVAPEKDISLIELVAKVRARKHGAVRNAPLDRRRGVHPGLGKTDHQIALARVVGSLGPVQAIEREQAHFLGRDHDYAAVRASFSTRSRSAAASMSPSRARSMMRAAMTSRPR